MATIRNRKNYQSDFKAKVALETVRGRLTINEISKQFGVHLESDFQMEKTICGINAKGRHKYGHKAVFERFEKVAERPMFIGGGDQNRTDE